MKREWKCRAAAALVAVLGLTAPAQATQDGWPGLFDVTGVALSDALNIRREPHASAEIIGALPHDATDIEVVAPDEWENWGLINFGEQSGWVSLRFLARQPGNLDGLFPEITSCYGTEPFWSLARESGTVTLDVAFDDVPALAELVDWEAGTLNHRGRFSFATPSMTAVIARQSCNDGMTDQEFGLEINLIQSGEPKHLQGCCSIRPRGE